MNPFGPPNASFCAADEGQNLDFRHALYAVQSPLENSGFRRNQKLIDIAIDWN